MNFNADMFGILIGVSTGTWLLVNRVFLKSGVKLIVSTIHQRYLVNIKNSEGKSISLEKVTRLAVSSSVLAVAIFLVVLVHGLDMTVAVEQIGEFEYAGSLLDATFLKCFLDAEVVNGAEWYVGWLDIILTIASIYLGSKLLHRFEQYFGFKYDTAKKANV